MQGGMNVKGNYSDLWRAIIRPNREVYDTSDLGMTSQTMTFRSSGI